MNMREALGFVMLAVGVVGIMGGGALITRGQTMGWVGLAIAPLLLLIAYRRIRAPAVHPSGRDR